jgi:hypothetical protein
MKKTIFFGGENRNFHFIWNQLHSRGLYRYYHITKIITVGECLFISLSYFQQNDARPHAPITHNNYIIICDLLTLFHPEF